ncbi:MAG: DoxX family protein [Patescibacteria group bacterium]
MMMDDAHRAMLRKNGTLVGRILMGLLFFGSGLSILLMTGVSGTASYFSSIGIPMAGIVAWLVVVLKIVAGGALIAGFRSGLAAASLILFTAAATVIAHLDLNDPGLFKNLAIIGGLLYVMAYGPGEGWNVGAMKHETPTPTPEPQPENPPMSHM